MRKIMIVMKGGQTPTRRFATRILQETYCSIYNKKIEELDDVEVRMGRKYLEKEEMLREINDADMVVAIVEYLFPPTAYSAYAIAGTGLEEYRKALNEARPSETSWDCAMQLRKKQEAGILPRFEIET